LHDLPVFIVFFFGGQGVTGCDEPLNLRILGNQGGIRRLAINKPDQVLDPESLFRVATIN
jgi:hypothetical protein